MRLWLRRNDIDEYDVKYGAWRLYDIIYDDLIDGGINYDRDVKGKKRKNAEKTLSHRGKSVCIDISGETDFNFSRKKNFGWGKSREQFFKWYSKQLEGQEKADYLEQVNRCVKNYHSQHNISIMPQNGALNLAKKMLGNDRLDVFIWALNEYYENGNGLILNCSSNEYLPSLKLFLGLFSGVNDYCRCMYQIDEDLVQRLVVSGTKPLDCVSRAKEYMDLAEEFWAQRDKYINMKLRGQ